ncbi:hypothetical protein HWV62_39666 [Athelia sp. TMB]|nr:hypothetical protein HWV62_39666 [Athelia sp. TMB]
MIAFTLPSLLSLLVIATSALGSPIPSEYGGLKISGVSLKGLICDIPFIDKLLCPPKGPSGPSVTTSLGVAAGVNDINGALRFPVRYGSAARWKASSMATTWALPNGSKNVSALPLVCPQPDVDDSQMSEDCLSMILYVPVNLKAGAGVPTMVWIHGGSFIEGGASNPGLDGSKLASATGAIVAVVQYRLGAFGFLGPDGTTNLGLKDIVTALQFLAKTVPAFGGSTSKITVAGQSSGANMIRALLAVPSASSLFQSAIIQSDPMDYGFLSPTVQKEMQTYFNNGVNCAATNTACLNALSVDTIINAQMDLYDNAFYDIDPSVTQAQPIRVVHDGTFITSTMDSSTPFPKVSKPLLISTVLNEAGASIYGTFNTSLPEAELDYVVNATFGAPRTNQIMSSALYVTPGTNAATSNEDARTQLQTLGTDYIWKCSSWTMARNWVTNGGSAYVGMYTVGATYPGNDQIPYCTQPGVVCHQDDIEIVFGTVPSPNSAQASLTTEMQARYKAFLNTGNPNPSGSSLAQWAPATTTNSNALTLGGTGLVPVGACTVGFWGQEVQYDYQVFNI